MYTVVWLERINPEYSQDRYERLETTEEVKELIKHLKNHSSSTSLDDVLVFPPNSEISPYSFLMEE